MSFTLKQDVLFCECQLKIIEYSMYSNQPKILRSSAELLEHIMRRRDLVQIKGSKIGTKFVPRRLLNISFHGYTRIP